MHDFSLSQAASSSVLGMRRRRRRRDHFAGLRSVCPETVPQWGSSYPARGPRLGDPEAEQIRNILKISEVSYLEIDPSEVGTEPS